MQTKAKTYALYAALAAVAVLAVACAWLARTVLLQRRELSEHRRAEHVGRTVRDCLFSRLSIGDDLEKKSAAGDAGKKEGSPEEMARKLKCYLEMLDAAEKHESEDALAFSLSLLFDLSDDDKGFDHIPGGGEMVRRRLPAIRKGLSSEEAGLRSLAAMVLLVIGERSDMEAVGRAFSEMPGGRFLALAARAKAREGKEPDEKEMMREMVRALNSEVDLDRVVALMFFSLVQVEGKSLLDLLKSDVPSERQEAAAHLGKMAGDGVEVDVEGIRTWLSKMDKMREAQQALDDGPTRRVHCRLRFELSAPGDFAASDRHDLKLIHGIVAADTTITMWESSVTRSGKPPWLIDQKLVMSTGKYVADVTVDGRYVGKASYRVCDDGSIDPKVVTLVLTPKPPEPVKVNFKVELTPPDDLPPAERHSYSETIHQLKEPVVESVVDKNATRAVIIPMTVHHPLRSPPPWTFEFGDSLEPGRHLMRIVLDETYGCYVPLEVFPDGRVEPAEIKVKADRKIHQCRVKCEINGPKGALAIEDPRFTARYVKRVDGMEARIVSGLWYSRLDGRAPWTVEDEVELMTGEYHVKAQVGPYYAGRASFKVLPDGRTEPSALRITLRRKSRAR
ncbi:MAG: hypothetical protein ACYSU0_01435 [Planctomycetota bacterium]